jgi:hypothetical protein
LKEGGSMITCFVSSNAVQYIRSMPSFNEVTYNLVDPGLNISTIKDAGYVPRRPPGSRLVGQSDNVAIVEWPRIPTGYMLAIHNDAPPPLKRRVDPEFTGLQSGLTMTFSEKDNGEVFTSQWNNRFGVGVANRLNGVAVYLNASTTYSVPSQYSTH